MTCRDAMPLIGAYLDGELDLVRALELESHSRECPACSAEMDCHRRLSAAVTTAPYYRATEAFRARLESAGAPVWRRPAAWLALAASILIAVLLTGRAPSTDLAGEVVHAYVRSVRAGHLVDVAATGGRAVRPWFAGKLDYSLDVENISGRGFVLTGGRLDSLNGRTVAVLVYQHGRHVVNVFVWPAATGADQSPTGRSIDGFNTVNWRADGMNWWAISDLDLGQLEELPLCPCFMPVHEALRG